MDTKIIKKIKSFELLKDGWKFGGGKSFNENTINTAIEVAKIVTCKQFRVDAFPGARGDIVIAVYGDSADFSLEVQQDMSIIIATEGAFDVIVDDSKINLTQISWLVEQLCTDFSFEEFEDCYNEVISGEKKE